MKHFLLIIFISIPFLGFPQATKKIKQKFKHTKYKEVFYVLVDQPARKHGTYLLINNDKVIIEQGNYHRGKKSGEWKYYYDDCGISKLIKEGFFTDGKRSGIWNYYKISGELKSTYNCNNGTLRNGKGELIELEEDEKGIVRVRYRFGYYAMINDIRQEIKYPTIARENGIEGQAVVKFTVYANGRYSEPKVMKDPGGGCGDEFLRVIKKLQGNFIPATQNGTPIDYDVFIPCNFRLSENGSSCNKKRRRKR